MESDKGLPVVYEYDGYADGSPVYDEASCPTCGYGFERNKSPWGEPYCPHCGQPIAWKEEEMGWR